MFFSHLRSFVFNSQIFFNSPCLEGLGEHIWSFRSTVVPQRSQFVTKKSCSRYYVPIATLYSDHIQ